MHNPIHYQVPRTNARHDLAFNPSLTENTLPIANAQCMGSLAPGSPEHETQLADYRGDYWS